MNLFDIQLFPPADEEPEEDGLFPLPFPQAMEQTSEHLALFAQAIGRYRKELVKVGVPDALVNTLILEYHRFILSGTPRLWIANLGESGEES